MLYRTTHDQSTYRQKKTSSMQSTRRDLHHTWLHCETNEKYTWEISDTSLAFLAIKLSIEGNGLSSRVYFKATDSHSCLLYLSSRPLHVKNSIPFSQFLRLRRLSSDDCDFPTYQRQCASFFVKTWLRNRERLGRGYEISEESQSSLHRPLKFLKGSYYLTVQSVNLLQYVSDFALSFLEHVSELKLILVRLRNLWKRGVM